MGMIRRLTRFVGSEVTLELCKVRGVKAEQCSAETEAEEEKDLYR